jgi:hypothetical protein
VLPSAETVSFVLFGMNGKKKDGGKKKGDQNKRKRDKEET